MASPAVVVEGLPNLVRTLREAGVDVSELKTATERAGQIVLAAAMQGAPRRSGALGATGKKSRNARRIRISFGNARTPYAGPIHWGWPRRNIAANPFVQRAALTTEPVWVRAYVDELERIAASIKGV